MTTLRKIEAFVIVAVIAFIGIIYAFKEKPLNAPIKVNVPVSDTSAQNQNTPLQEVPTTVINYNGQEGKTALEILKAGHRVDVKHYSFGDMVTGIDGIAPDSKHFWSFYVNGALAQVGADSFVTKSSDQIKWQVDTVVDYTK